MPEAAALWYGTAGRTMLLQTCLEQSPKIGQADSQGSAFPPRPVIVCLGDLSNYRCWLGPTKLSKLWFVSSPMYQVRRPRMANILQFRPTSYRHVFDYITLNLIIKTLLLKKWLVFKFHCLFQSSHWKHFRKLKCNKLFKARIEIVKR